MRKHIFPFAGLMLMILPAAAGAQSKEPLEERLRRLEKTIGAVRELKFKEPVKARIIARPKDAGPKLQGYYSPKEKSLFLYDDLKDNYENGVLVHEMVHALQDQHFDLTKLKARLHQTPGTDAELALAALIEGDATFTMIEVLKKDQPKAAAMLDVPLAKARNLDNAFLYAQGARFVKALKERAGWTVVNQSYQFVPRNTASILHQTTVSTIDLGPGKVQGEFGLIKLLAGHSGTRDQAFTVVSGWRGDRIIESSAGGAAWAVAFAKDDNAQAFARTLIDFKAAQHVDFTPPKLEAAGVHAGRNKNGASWTVIQRGKRVYAIDAPTPDIARRLRDGLEGPVPMAVWPKDSADRAVEFGHMIDRLLDADVICIGEAHNAELHHRAQLQIIKALHARDDRLAVGLEMFQKPFQEPLDRYIKGESNETEFLKATEYAKRWGYDWSLYQPIVEFCRKNRIPVAALNAPKELTGKISKSGYASLSDDEKQQLGAIDFHRKKHRDHWLEELPKLHGNAKATPEQKERSYQVMATWDSVMAQAAAQFQKERQVRRMVILAGSGHIDHRFGIPERIAEQGGRVMTIKLAPAGPAKVNGANAPADWVIGF